MTLVREYQPTFVLGDGVTKEFSFLFEEVSANFVKVIVKHSDNSTYVPVFSVDLDSHKVVFGESETAPLDTDLVCIYRETPDLQDTPFRTLQGYDAKALENILSKIVAMIQELKASGFSTQILQGTPWQLDLLQPADDNASVVIDYNARILKKGLYFQIVSGNLQVSADGSSFITMPKSADITEFRQLETVLEDLTVQYRLQYKVNGVWYNAESNAEATADEALQVAQEARTVARNASEKVDTFDGRLIAAEQDASDAKDAAQDAKDQVDDLQDEVDSLKGLGRFLSVWNSATGLAETNPPESPYTYKSGDYFLVGTVSTATPAVNYKPDGATYTTGVASTTVESDTVKVNDVYIYDGTNWKLQANSQRDVVFSAIQGSPYDNTALGNALNGKVNTTAFSNKVYGTDANGDQAVISYAASNTASTIAYRTTAGQLSVAATPTSDTHAASKKYVDDGLAPKISNTATDSTSISIMGTPISVARAINIGSSSNASGTNGVAIGASASSSTNSVSIGRSANTSANSVAVGRGATASGTYSTALGTTSVASADNAIQIGNGTNSTNSTLYVGFYDANDPTNWQLLDGTTGLIPDARISTNIARTSALPSDFTGATAGDAGVNGLVPAPAAGDQGKFLQGDGSWTTVDALPTQTGNSGKLVTTNGTSASWTEIKTINNGSLLGSGNIDVLVNEATPASSLGIGYTTINTTYTDSINIGNGAQVGANNALALGAFASAEGQDSIAIYSSTGTAHRARTTHTGNIAIGYNALAINAAYTIAIGYNAYAQGINSIQLGTGNVALQNTFQVWTYPMLDKTTGLIPTDRVSVMTGASANDAGAKGLVPAPSAGDQQKFLQGDGTWANPTAATAWGNITGTLSDQTDLDTALSGKADTDLSNITATGKENVIAYALANIQNTDNTKIGYVYHGYINFGTIKAPAGGKWLVLYTLQVQNNSGVAYRFSADMVSPVGSIVAGGTSIINARSAYTNEALLLKIE